MHMYHHDIKAADQLRPASEFGRRNSNRTAYVGNGEPFSAAPLSGYATRADTLRCRDGVRRCWDELMKVDVTRPYSRSRLLDHLTDYLQLTRPRLALLVLATTAAGWLLATGDTPDWNALRGSLIAVSALFAGASALNQLLERNTDALMPRTANRPLPAGRLEPLEALIFGCGLGAGGLGYLLATGQSLAAGLGLFAFVSYVFVYTPLKRRT